MYIQQKFDIFFQKTNACSNNGISKNPTIPHGKICVGFTPDEEVGHGVDRFDLRSFDAAFAYTVDGGQIGELESENFNASRAIINIMGKSVHTGAAKGIMINAALIAAELAARVPENEIPAKTEGYEGFYHLLELTGHVEHAKVIFLLRDFDINGLNARKAFIEKTVAELNEIAVEYREISGPRFSQGVFFILRAYVNSHVFNLWGGFFFFFVLRMYGLYPDYARDPVPADFHPLAV